MMWYRIEAPRAVGALRFDDADKAVEGARYFMKFMAGWTEHEVENYCLARHWRYYKLEQTEIPWELE